MKMEALEQLKRSHSDLRSYLIEQGEISFANSVEQMSPKVLLLASASLFEVRVTEALVEHAQLNGSTTVSEFVERKGLKRQYHTLFAWDASNANTLWSLFGQEFTAYAKALVAKDEELEAAIRAFLEIGNLRNQMVHLGYLAFELDKTADEVFHSAQTADHFVRRLPQILQGFEGGPTKVAYIFPM